MKILCIGEALIDMICTDKGMPLSKGENFLKQPGGAPTNVAAAIGALGGAVALAAKVGKDPFGQQLIHAMQSFGVQTNYMLAAETHFTTLAFVSLMEDGERDFVFNRGADGLLSAADIDAIPLDEFGMVHFGSATAFLPGPLQLAYVQLLLKAKEKNKFISFDPNYRHLLFKNNKPSFIQQSWPFLQQSNFFKLSEEEALLLTNTKTVEAAANQLLQKTDSVFAITLGKQGTLFGFDNNHLLIPSIDITAVDTTGAGDAFVGAVLFQLSTFSSEAIQKLSLQEWSKIIAFGNQMGARTCQYLGAMEAFRHLGDAITKA